MLTLATNDCCGVLGIERSDLAAAKDHSDANIYARLIVALLGRGEQTTLTKVAEEAIATARRLHAIVSKSRKRLLARDDATVFSLRLFELLPQHPIVTVNLAVDMLECSRPAATKTLRVLDAADVLHALDDRKKNRAVVFTEYLDHLREGTIVKT